MHMRCNDCCGAFTAGVPPLPVPVTIAQRAADHAAAPSPPSLVFVLLLLAVFVWRTLLHCNNVIPAWHHPSPSPIHAVTHSSLTSEVKSHPTQVQRCTDIFVPARKYATIAHTPLIQAVGMCNAPCSMAQQ
eukprot:GHVU01017960.1.p1 GENE.GHVU01017960.1~~GHVU01017960.1.p1  ORF type:complete len:131 (-),score=2.74 GHVU01017960.1:675-1067(-)